MTESDTAPGANQPRRFLTKLPLPEFFGIEDRTQVEVSVVIGEKLTLIDEVRPKIDEAVVDADLVIDIEITKGNLPGAHYKSFDNGPNRAVYDFLDSPRGLDYDIDESLCDLFGYNATWNPNGYLRRAR